VTQRGDGGRSPSEAVTASGARHPLDALAEEYSERRRRGESPTISEFCRRRPELADEIRDLFPTLDLLESAAGATGALAPFDVSPPQELGDYRLLGEIGRGGMGVVYEAEQKSLARRVALKILPPRAVSNPSFVERFRREAQAAAGLDQPGIVPVHGVGEARGLHYYAMQFIDGVGLDAVIDELARRRTGRPPSGRTEGQRVAEIVDRWLARDASCDSSTEIGAVGSSAPTRTARPGPRGRYPSAVAAAGLRVAEALAGAHARGVLHRDIKPSNVLLDAKGRTWITDFGLCKLDGAEDLTHSGALLGTLRYMAPERFDGVSGVQADIYGLGLILWELLALAPVFGDGDRASLLGRITLEGAPRLRERDATIPVDLELIVSRATALDPARRYPTADALAQDLRAFLDGRPVMARNPSLAYHFRMSIRRNRALAATIATSLVLAIAGGSWAILRLEQSRDTAEANARTARHREAIAHLTAAAAAIDSGDSTAARARLERIPADLQGWEWRHFRGSVDDSIRDFPPGEIATYDLQYSRDGSRIIAACSDQVRVIATDTGTVESEFRTGRGNIFSLDVDPGTGRILTGHTSGCVAIWDAGTGALVREVRARTGIYCEHVRFGSGEVAAAGRDHEITIWPDAEAEPPRVLQHSAIVWAFEYTPDGRSIASVCNDGTVRLWDHRSGEVRWLAHHPGGRIAALAFSPDGTRLATGAIGSAFAIHDLATGELLVEVPGGPTTGIAFLDDGRLLTTSANVRSGEWLQIWDLASKRPVARLRGHSRNVMALALRADRLRATTSSWDGSMKEWSLALEGEPDVLTGPADDVYQPVWSPDGEWIAAPSRDSTVRVWDVRTGRLRRTLLDIRGGSWSVRFVDRWTLVGLGSIDLVVWDLRDGSVRAAVAFADRIEPRMEIEPDGSGLLLSDQSGELRRYSLPGLAEQAPVQLQACGVVAIAIDREGRRFATAGTDLRLRVFDLETLALQQEWSAHEKTISSLAFHPDGRRLASTSHDQSLRLWEIESGAEIATLTTGDRDLWLHTEALTSASFSPVGDRLAASSRDNTVHLFDIESRLEVAVLRGHTSWVSAVGWSPDGSHLASGSTDGTVRLWRTAPRTATLEERESLWIIERREKEFVASRLAEGESIGELAARIVADVSAPPAVREARLGAVHARSGEPEALLDTAWEILTRRALSPRDRELAASLVNGQRPRYGRHQRQALLWGLAEFRGGSLRSAEHELDMASRMLPLEGHDHAAILGLLAAIQDRSGRSELASRTRERYQQALAALEPEIRSNLEAAVSRCLDAPP